MLTKYTKQRQTVQKKKKKKRQANKKCTMLICSWNPHVFKYILYIATYFIPYTYPVILEMLGFDECYFIVQYLVGSVEALFL